MPQPIYIHIFMYIRIYIYTHIDMPASRCCPQNYAKQWPEDRHFGVPVLQPIPEHGDWTPG